MGVKQSTVPFVGTNEQYDKLLSVIEEHKDDKGALMPIMQKAQEIYGYLPIEVQSIISNKMVIPMEKIYGIATFYSQFSFESQRKTCGFNMLGNSMLCKRCR